MATRSASAVRASTAPPSIAPPSTASPSTIPASTADSTHDINFTIRFCPTYIIDTHPAQFGKFFAIILAQMLHPDVFTAYSFCRVNNSIETEMRFRGTDHARRLVLREIWRGYASVKWEGTVKIESTDMNELFRDQNEGLKSSKQDKRGPVTDATKKSQS
ncbi:MAG: hypothetical protein Q9218_000812 [Villophora microphyllina]